MPPTQGDDVTQLLQAWAAGDLQARERVLVLVYAELRRRAAAQLRHERRGHTLQATALVHEAYIRLVDQRRAAWRNRVQLLAVASQVMRRILVDGARARRAEKRGAGGVHLTLDEAPPVAVPAIDVNVLDLDAALERLAAFDRRKGQIAELRSSAASRWRKRDRCCRCQRRRSNAIGRRRAPGCFASCRRVRRGRAMTPERWQEVDRVWHAVLARPEPERAAAVVELCAGDDDLRREVESLLASLGQASAAGFGVAPAVAAPVTSLIGRHLGPYAVTSLLGVGGMGEVYRAHDSTLGRDVALKILPDVWLGDAERRMRFEREARLLASLNHPNIADRSGSPARAPSAAPIIPPARTGRRST